MALAEAGSPPGQRRFMRRSGSFRLQRKVAVFPRLIRPPPQLPLAAALLLASQARCTQPPQLTGWSITSHSTRLNKNIDADEVTWRAAYGEGWAAGCMGDGHTIRAVCSTGTFKESDALNSSLYTGKAENRMGQYKACTRSARGRQHA